MAVLSMKKIDIVALQKERKPILELLQVMGVTEIIDVEREGIHKVNTQSFIDEFNKDMETALYAKELISKYVNRKKSMLSSFLEGPEISQEEFRNRGKVYKDVISLCEDIIHVKQSIDEYSDKINQLETEYDALKVWSSLEIPADLKGTKHTKVFIGSIQGSKTIEDILSSIDEELVHGEIVSSFKDQTCFMVVCHKDVSVQVEKNLRLLNFIPLDNSFSQLPKEKINEIEALHKELLLSLEDKKEKLKNYAERIEDIEFVIDYLSIRRDKYEVINKLCNTSYTFIISAYIPKKEVERCVNLLNSRFTVAVDIYDPEDTEDVPVLLENSTFVAPMESITQMYALPGKEDIDPSPVMAFFYYVLFGLMFSDAGYGVVMALVSFVILRKKNLKESSKKTFGMFFYCGISTIFWGAIFGSWFGDIVPVIYREFLNKEAPRMYLWFDPVSYPMKFLIFAFLLGMTHLFSGVVTRGLMYANERKILDAIFSTIPIIVLVTGGALLAGNYVVEVPKGLVQLGKYLASAGVVLVVLAEIRTAKNLIVGVGSGLYSLYNVFSGYLSDILSYSRLLALGLATGSIAGVINLMGTLPESTTVKLIVLPIVFIFGHGANFAINALGAYVHTNRLMFVELFTKFYEGGGRAFKPFKIIDSVKIKEDF